MQRFISNYIEDYQRWNDAAYHYSQTHKIDTEIINRKYRKFARKYCDDSVKFQGAAFGSRSIHSGKTEKILSVQNSNREWTVITENVEDFGAWKHASVYEYHVIENKKKLKLINVFFVDDKDGKKYECL